jgi:ABC-2 type transport system ATP-binding protein
MIAEIKNMVKRYNDTVAVDNVSLTIHEGEIFGLLGPNGAGKTSLIHTLLGITPMSSGEIKIFGKDFTAYEQEIKSKIGIVPQEIAIYNDLTAYENVMFFAKLYNIQRNQRKAAVADALNFVDLWEKRNQLPKSFSGGMKRRLNIACGVVHRPKLIVMDEPTVGIDPQSRSHILESVRKLNQESTTVIYTSHYMEEVEELCTRIGIMDHGRIIALGTFGDLQALVSQYDKISVELDTANDQVVSIVKSVQGVKDCLLDNKQLTVMTRRNSPNLGKITEAVIASGASVLSITVAKPSLERVFLTLTGRRLRE